MPFSYFSLNQILPLIPSIIISGLSVFYFQKNKIESSLVLLFIGALGVGCFIALLDPYLHTWDEQYHALVAKNMMDNPFYPLLYKNPILHYDYKLWTDNHIWLHKQPLFLWQMALSIKIFGVNQFSVRLPSVIMHAIIPIFIYRIGKISLNNKAGFYGALFFSLAYYPLELVSGLYFSDHNDFVFLFYITASFWAWFEYYNSGKNYWLILIGLFAGCAVLVKWLMGLLVFICWAFTFFSDRRKMLQGRTYIPILKSFIISVIVFLPWQIYILCRFPLESKYEFAGFSNHLFIALDGNEGNFWFHFEGTKMLYGYFSPFFIVISLIILSRKITLTNYRIFIFVAIIFVYLFYSVAATKSYSFCIIVSPFICLGFSSLFSTVIIFFDEKLARKSMKIFLFLLLLLPTCYFLINMEKIQINHTLKPSENDYYRKNALAERALINNLDNLLPDKRYIIFNTLYNQGGNIPFMFYSDYIAYRFIPSKEQCDEVIKKGYKIAVLDLGNLPGYIINDKNIIKIPPQ